MTFSEMMKTAFSGAFVDLTFGQSVLIMLTALVCAALICLVYRLSYRGALFSRSFCASLFAMTLITTLLIMAIRTNIYLSLGTLGALSIVRFRTAVKEPMDMAYLFLSISAGIICGANLLGIALFGVVLIGAILYAVGHMPKMGGTYIVMVTADSKREQAITKELRDSTRSVTLKSKTLVAGEGEYAWEVALRGGDDAFMTRISTMPGVKSATMVKSNSEYI
jgi:uncharacterized membrane protein YhiD involved in acid resistance